MVDDSADNAAVVAHVPAKPELTLAQKRFYASQECTEAREALQCLVDSAAFNTDSKYFQADELSFVDRHLHYLSTHPTTNAEGYVSNLKLMTRNAAR